MPMLIKIVSSDFSGLGKDKNLTEDFYVKLVFHSQKIAMHIINTRIHHE